MLCPRAWVEQPPENLHRLIQHNYIEMSDICSIKHMIAYAKGWPGKVFILGAEYTVAVILPPLNV